MIRFLAQLRSHLLFLVAVLAVCLTPHTHATAAPGRLFSEVLISGDSVFQDCLADGVLSQAGTAHVGSEVEPWVAVNPTNSLNIAATWQQDRWSDGGARGLVAGISLDGGVTWERVVIPGLTPCSGGSFIRASDPWLDFSPDGTLHHIALAIGTGGTSAILASKSGDGGLTWSAPRRIVDSSSPLFNDKESITADPKDPALVYAVWDQLNFSANRGPALFARSTDGGDSWNGPVVIHDPGRSNQTLGNRLVVLPDGTLLAFFTEIRNTPTGVRFFLAFKRSTDKGVSWQPQFGTARVAEIQPRAAADPDQRRGIRDGSFLFDVAVDRSSGGIYVVWQDGSFGAFQFPSVAFSLSRDGGFTWTQPLAVNGTPEHLGNRERQAFLPSVQVAGNGTVGVSFYDFRFNGAEPEALTDHWLTWCHPDAVDCSRPSRWLDEVRITETSFDILQAPVARGLFLGDYMGLTADDNDFITVYTRPHEEDRSSAFSRRLAVEPVVAPESLAYWKKQVRGHLGEKGKVEVSSSVLLEALADIRALHDLFGSVVGLAGLGLVLDPPSPAAELQRARGELMALLLNLADSRLSPHVEAYAGISVVQAAGAIIEVVQDPQAGKRDLKAARSVARAINKGKLPLDAADDSDSDSAP